MNPAPYEILITRRAEKDIEKLSPQLKDKLYGILTEVIAVNPFEGKKLVGDLEGYYSHRLNYQDRIVYSIHSKRRTVYIERARTHYE
ncbi:MAG: type II toxin-antitoxin system RelE/ParE family toxin [Candidatus Omnitrophica bacterium]|nr:type II toxin-antitoxin system RelE/ParE family toxin [Candidatus Omnitrophota bacterium]